MKQRIIIGLITAVICVCSTANENELAEASMGTKGAPDTWAVWGGNTQIEWNRELLSELGMELSAPAERINATAPGPEQFAIRESGGIEFRVRGIAFDGFVSGSLQLRGGYDLDVRGMTISLRNALLAVVPGNPYRLDVISSDGKAWLFIDRLMYEIDPRTNTLDIQAMDLRMSAELAALVDHPQLDGQVVANMELTTRVFRGGVDDPEIIRGFGCPSSSKWPGDPVVGETDTFYEADVFMDSFSISYLSGLGEDGPGGNDGRIKYAPSSTLRNNRSNGSAIATVPGDPLGTSKVLYAADVPWHRKFSGDCDPYANDQHPYLIWNLYRINADGQIDQIGRSGVKHAFLTINSGCDDHPGSGHILGRGCGDTYGVGNNDSSDDLGPRSEVIPATGQWARCESIYDPDCDASESFPNYDSFTHRLLASESDIDPAENPGATYLFESWYIVREDVDIYNTMQTRPVTFNWTGSIWNVNDGSSSALELGSAIDRWVAPDSANADELNTEIDRPEGHIKVAVKTVDLGSGLYRFDYAVMNYDFGIPVIDTYDSNDLGGGMDGVISAEPNLKLQSNDGLVSFTVPTGSGATITNLRFEDGDPEPTNDWVASIDANSVTWTAPADASLNWGSMMSFSLTADVSPNQSDVAMVTADVSGTDIIFADSLIPSGPVIPTFSVGGDVSGLASAASVVLAQGAEQLTVSANEGFTFLNELENGESYEVEVETQPADAVCTVTDGSGIINNADVTNVAVSCQTAFTIGGVVTGLAALETVTVQVDSSALGGVMESMVVSDDGVFAFDQLLPDAATYTVTITSDTTANGCAIAGGTGTVDAADVVSIAVNCGQFMKDGFESP